jgi:hypothetical protein
VLKRRLTVATAVAVVLLAAIPQPAAACSAGPSFEPREYTQLLVLGRVTSVTLGGAAPFGFREAVVSLDVVHVYRGVATTPLRFVDTASASIRRDARGQEVAEYAGGSGACGTIDEDPVGTYVLIALARGDDARWHANRLYGALYGETLNLPAFRWLLQRHGVVVPFLVADPIHDALASPALA